MSRLMLRSRIGPLGSMRRRASGLNLRGVGRCMKTAASLALFSAASIALQVGMAAACNYDGSPGAGPTYPRAAEVRAALQRPSNAQVLDKQLVSPSFVNMFGYHRAVRRLQRLREALERVGGQAAGTSFSLLLVESGLWSRYSPDTEGVSIAVHTAGPQPADVVVLTGEAAIEAIASGRLSAEEALRLGLILIEGSASAKVAPLLRAALDLTAEGL